MTKDQEYEDLNRRIVLLEIEVRYKNAEITVLKKLMVDMDKRSVSDETILTANNMAVSNKSLPLGKYRNDLDA